MLVIGGCSMVSDSDEGQVSGVLGYNPGDRSWKELPRLLKARSGPDFTVAVVAGDVLAIGGFRDTDGMTEEIYWVTSVERYNRHSRCWEAIASLDRSLSCSAATVVQV
uniref:Uncharacterized protein n=1 Tax=Eutreptiella gymnastica TaxID=73025 RepID=A0A7S1IC88_9EUGL|mmetsp:Transcript_146130/g.255174  ORF Transcript_146130/g.255174 Transcript_146130/m.255174 type:complete len:108 (+) Transcript_146130:101-424(+)